MALEVFNRYEHKYLIDEKAYRKISGVLEKYMIPDAYNKNLLPYSITNIYYDTDDDFLIRNSLSSPLYKEKLRLRAYGVPDMQTKVFLEIKKKYDGIVNKRRTALILGEAYEFLRTGTEPSYSDYMNSQVLHEISYFLSLYELKPKLYIAYDRVAYFEKHDGELRISFDSNIRTRRTNLGLENGDYGEQLLKRGTYLMEIKTSLAKPLWLCRMLSETGLVRTSFSKYGTEFKNSKLKAI